jgi:hypothetical protein
VALSAQTFGASVFATLRRWRRASSLVASDERFQVAALDNIEIHQPDVGDAHPRQRLRDNGSHAPGPDDPGPATAFRFGLSV